MRLKEIRKKNNLSQQNVADSLNIPLRTYCGYEREERTPTPEMMCKMADYFNVSLDELFGRSSEPAMFDDARVERPEILELFDSLSPAQQQNLLNYARGMAVANQLENEESIRNQKRA